MRYRLDSQEVMIDIGIPEEPVVFGPMIIADGEIDDV